MFGYYDRAVEAKLVGRRSDIAYWLKKAEAAANDPALPAALSKEAVDQATKIRELQKPDPTPLGYSACDGFGPISTITLTR